MNYKCNGYKRDPKDKIYIPFERDKISGVSDPSTINNSDNIDLRQFSYSRRDQGQTESCVAHGLLKNLEIKTAEKFGLDKYIALSRLALYWGCRDEMSPKQTHLDNGTNISLGLDVLKRFGICREKTWDFNIENINVSPSILSIRESYLNKISNSFKIDSNGNQRIDDIILNLKNNNPVTFGTTVGDEWFNYTITSDPISKCTNPKGGHCMCIVGYINGLFVIENSWALWGNQGFAFVDPVVIGNADWTNDCWVIACEYDSFWEK